MGGRSWAAPAVSQDRLRAARMPSAARAAPGAGPPALEVAIEGGASLGYDPHGTVASLLAILRERVPLEHAVSAERLVPGTWRRLAEDDPTADPGRVRLYLQSVADGEIIHGALHGRGVQVGCNLLTISVQMRDGTSQAARSRHSGGRGGGGGRPAPPPPPGPTVIPGDVWTRALWPPRVLLARRPTHG